MNAHTIGGISLILSIVAKPVFIAAAIMLVAQIAFIFFMRRRTIKRLDRMIAEEEAAGEILVHEGIYDLYSDGIRRPSQAFVAYFNGIVRSGRQVTPADVEKFDEVMEGSLDKSPTKIE